MAKKKKPYIFIIEVTARSVKGVKPLNSKLRGVGVADVPNARVMLETRALDDIRTAYLVKYPGIPMQFTVKSTRIDQDFLIVEGLDAEPEPEPQTEQENEQNEQSEQIIDDLCPDENPGNSAQDVDKPTES